MVSNDGRNLTGEWSEEYHVDKNDKPGFQINVFVREQQSVIDAHPTPVFSPCEALQRIEVFDFLIFSGFLREERETSYPLSISCLSFCLCCSKWTALCAAGRVSPTTRPMGTDDDDHKG